jgi:hypothetical protein
MDAFSRELITKAWEARSEAARLCVESQHLIHEAKVLRDQAANVAKLILREPFQKQS